MRGCFTIRVSLVEEFAQKRTALREHLVDVPVGLLHRIEYLRDMADRDLLVEQVAHGIHEDHPGLLPFKRLQKPFGP